MTNFLRRATTFMDDYRKLDGSPTRMSDVDEMVAMLRGAFEEGQRSNEKHLLESVVVAGEALRAMPSNERASGMVGLWSALDDLSLSHRNSKKVVNAPPLEAVKPGGCGCVCSECLHYGIKTHGLCVYSCALKTRSTVEAWRAERMSPSPAPIPMFLTCPKCNARHIDEGDFATKVHHTHSCQSCGLTWRPAVVPTVGVAFLPGFKSETKPSVSPERKP